MNRDYDGTELCGLAEAHGAHSWDRGDLWFVTCPGRQLDRLVDELVDQVDDMALRLLGAGLMPWQRDLVVNVLLSPTLQLQLRPMPRKGRQL